MFPCSERDDRRHPRLTSSRRRCSWASIWSACCMVWPMSSRPFQQQMLAECVDLEMDFLAARPAPPPGAARSTVSLALPPMPRVLDQHVAHRARQADGQDAVLEAVVVEDVGEVGRDHAAYAEIQQRPGRVLTRRAAAEILMRDQDFRVAVRLLVEHELRRARRRPGESASVLNRCWPGPERLMVFRKRAGMILSVSTLASGSRRGAMPVSVVNFVHDSPPPRQASSRTSARCVR